MVKRHESTPACAIRGCDRAARRLGMCAEHAALAGREYSLRAATESLQASHRAAAKVRREAQAHVRKVLRDDPS